MQNYDTLALVVINIMSFNIICKIHNHKNVFGDQSLYELISLQPELWSFIAIYRDFVSLDGESIQHL